MSEPVIHVPYLFYELVVFGESEKAVGSMRLNHKDYENVKKQIRERKTKIVFDMLESDCPMSINTDKYSRVWVEMHEEQVVKGENGLIIDPYTNQPAVKDKKLVIQ